MLLIKWRDGGSPLWWRRDAQCGDSGEKNEIKSRGKMRNRDI